MKNKKFSTFISGVLAGLMLMACGTAAFAAGGGVSLGNLGLCINGRSFIQRGEGIKNEAGETIPSSISYATENGSETLYMPIQTIAQLLDIPVGQQDGVVYLGYQPVKPSDSKQTTAAAGTEDSSNVLASIKGENGTVTIAGGTDELKKANPLYAEKPLHRAGETAGRYTETEPYWPGIQQFIRYQALDKKLAGRFMVYDWYSAPIEDEGGYCALSVTNTSDVPLILNITVCSTITEDSFPLTIVPAGETVVRTFHAEEYTGALHQPDLLIWLQQDTSNGSLATDISATVSMVTYDPNQDGLADIS
ncbi:hypothetical protein D1646_02105 [Pseudoflavonifractor sp. 60]|uniref:hypothetical protein n=1 Tax=Pseudoflavonifractor sp. 60 TaxID=2304576 RepID=UPI001369CB5A|nr:hypothetical protein [Pseudoflavonifractor sp. 60]NBI65620.1 hypothetical protein [Pseudoflavonifractor sp. 60]